MKIETKYEVGESTWVIHANEIYELEIKVIFIKADGEGIEIEYSLDGDVYVELDEDRVFTSREKLIDSITNSDKLEQFNKNSRTYYED